MVVWMFVKLVYCENKNTWANVDNVVDIYARVVIFSHAVVGWWISSARYTIAAYNRHLGELMNVLITNATQFYILPFYQKLHWFSWIFYQWRAILYRGSKIDGEYYKDTADLKWGCYDAKMSVSANQSAGIAWNVCYVSITLFQCSRAGKVCEL